jgi:hypothetical protein
MQSSVGSLCQGKMLASMKNLRDSLSDCTIWLTCLSSSHTQTLVMETSYPSITMTTSVEHCSQLVRFSGSSCRGKVGIVQQNANKSLLVMLDINLKIKCCKWIILCFSQMQFWIQSLQISVQFIELVCCMKVSDIYFSSLCLIVVIFVLKQIICVFFFTQSNLYGLL